VVKRPKVGISPEFRLVLIFCSSIRKNTTTSPFVLHCAGVAFSADGLVSTNLERRGKLFLASHAISRKLRAELVLP